MIPAGRRFIVLTGLPGSGKTTLLRDFLAQPQAADTAVIVNAAGPDALGTAEVTRLSRGCVCCTAAGDLERTVLLLLTTRVRAGLPPPERIILETDGLARPEPILRAMAGLAGLQLRTSVVATFDCTGRDEPSDAAAAQWAGTQALVLTKRDLVTPAQRAEARRQAASAAPQAALIDMDRPEAALAAFTGRLEAAAMPSRLSAEPVVPDRKSGPAREPGR